ncbi:2233_t:CDS:1, partial [Acaulospora colombiana]
MSSTRSFQIQEAREWYEVAAILCRFTPDSPQEKVSPPGRAEYPQLIILQIRLAYEELLSRSNGINKPT